jgi:acyl carrier protein
MDDVATRCIQIIATAKGISPASISLDSSFDSLAVDSLDKINISFEVEDAFSIAIPDDSLNSLKTVGDVVRGVESLLQQQTAAAAPAATE